MGLGWSLLSEEESAVRKREGREGGEREEVDVFAGSKRDIFYFALTVVSPPAPRRALSASSVRYVADAGPSQAGSEGAGGSTTGAAAGAGAGASTFVAAGDRTSPSSFAAAAGGGAEAAVGAAAPVPPLSSAMTTTGVCREICCCSCCCLETASRGKQKQKERK